jgi:hypothetical protein
MRRQAFADTSVGIGADVLGVAVLVVIPLGLSVFSAR